MIVAANWKMHLTRNEKQVTCFVDDSEKESKKFDFQRSWKLMVKMSLRSKLKLNDLATTCY